MGVNFKGNLLLTMVNEPKISGVMPVLQMPFREDESIDFNILAKEIEHVITAGSDGVVLALASELFRLTHDERLELTKKIPEIVGGRGTVTISVGSETSRESVFYAEKAEHSGATAVMAIPPMAVALPEEKLFKYYRTIHDAITIPLVIQDASGYLGRSLSLNFQVRLRSELGPRIYFKPESQPIGPTLSQLHALLDNDDVVFEGSGGLYLVDSFRRGISGTMPGSDLIRGIVEIWQALRRGDDARAYEVYFPLASIVILQLTSIDAFLSIEKYLLVKQGIFTNRRLRQPSASLVDQYTEKEVDRLYAILERVL
jgi:dihydrodipicolinate synthase/N-acetylneuraminate lyase